jgi:hypothetical protein
MCDPMRGESNSPDAGVLECSGTGRCRNPIRVALAGACFGMRRTERSGGRSILCDAGEFGEQSPERVKRARGGPEKSGLKAFAAGPRGANPMGGAGVHRVKTPRGRKALSGGVSPETESLQAGLSPSGVRNTVGCNGTWVRFRSKGRQGLSGGETSEG